MHSRCKSISLCVQIDAFYAQVEENRNPDLRNRPLGKPPYHAAPAGLVTAGTSADLRGASRSFGAGVTQKYLIVTSNYHARARGVTKLQNIYDAKVPSAQISALVDVR